MQFLNYLLLLWNKTAFVLNFAFYFFSVPFSIYLLKILFLIYFFLVFSGQQKVLELIPSPRSKRGLIIRVPLCPLTFLQKQKSKLEIITLHFSFNQKSKRKNLISPYQFSYFKVARVVNIRLAFTDYLIFNLIILTGIWKTMYTGYLSQKLKTLTNSIVFNIFCYNFAHVSFLPMSNKEYSGIF